MLAGLRHLGALAKLQILGTPSNELTNCQDL
jgi:hypothetical protein